MSTHEHVGKHKAVDKAKLVYAATSVCRCGAGLAYEESDDPSKWAHGAWECSRVLKAEVELGLAPTKNEACATARPGWIAAWCGAYKDVTGQVHDLYPFWCYEIKSDRQPSACGATTRPADEARRHWWAPLTASPLKCATCGTPKTPESESQPCAGQ